MPMDIGLFAPDDANNTNRSYKRTLESSNGVTEEFSINELGNGVTELLSIQDNTDGVSGSKSPNSKCDSKKKSEVTEKNSGKTTSSDATYAGVALTAEIKNGAHAITNEESTPDPLCPHFQSLPAAIKPVSAMKGSREKRGVAPPTKLTVRWAPDVYDPIPTSASHSITNNRPQRQSKKNSKNKHKNSGKSSRGSKHKDKKQGRKRGGNSNNGFKLFEHEEEVVDSGQPPPPTTMDFHVGNPDQFCGSSFLKRYGRSLHLSSVAEAT